jgi:HEAT repeat protein
MIPIGLLPPALAVLACFVAGAVAALFGHGLWLRISEAWARRRIEDGRTSLYTLMRSGSGVPGGVRERCVEQLRRLPPRLQIRLVLSLARSLEPSAATPLCRVAEEIGLTGRAERDCRSRLWWRRLEGARLLTLLGADDRALPRLLDDPHPAVRRQAVEWAADDPVPGMVDGLVALLERPGADRFSAQDALLRAGSVAVEPLARLLEADEAPGTDAALRVAAALAHPRFTQPAIRLCSATDAGIRAAAAELLGSIGGEEGTVVLAELLDDGDPAVRAAAARSLGRLRYWASAPKLAGRMRDTSWQVRRAAGLALRAVGPPGLLVLRKMRSDANNFAADMARQVLDLPAGVGVLR